MGTNDQIFRPVTAITMGDPAGIGPEIVVGTMLDPSIIECCKPFVIGDAVILQRAADVLGKKIQIHKISDPDEALYEFGTIDILETGEYDTDSIVWGEVQALAGQMSYDWIMKSIELGLAGKVDAVSTSPINKQSIKLIGVKERWFEEGLRTRLGLLTHYFALRGFEPLDVADIRVSFTRGMPANLKEAAEIVHLAREAGAASVETAVRLLHRGEGWTQDEVDGEAGRIRAESGEGEEAS